MKRVKIAEYDESLTLKNAGIEPANDRKSESTKEDTKREKNDDHFAHVGSKLFGARSKRH